MRLPATVNGYLLYALAIYICKEIVNHTLCVCRRGGRVVHRRRIIRTRGLRDPRDFGFTRPHRVVVVATPFFKRAHSNFPSKRFGIPSSARTPLVAATFPRFPRRFQQNAMISKRTVHGCCRSDWPARTVVANFPVTVGRPARGEPRNVVRSECRRVDRSPRGPTAARARTYIVSGPRHPHRRLDPLPSISPQPCGPRRTGAPRPGSRRPREEPAARAKITTVARATRATAEGRRDLVSRNGPAEIVTTPSAACCSIG